MKVVALMGEPGCGKSTLMRRLMTQWRFDATTLKQDFKLVPYHYRGFPNGDIYILGKYEEGEVFAGTDRMSMAVQPEAIKFLDTLPDTAIVLFEGDRLCTASFLENCANKFDTKIIYLQTDRDIRKERYAERGSNQNETWLAGRESKIGNILTNMELMFITEKMKNNNIEEQNIVVDYINTLLQNGVMMKKVDVPAYKYDEDKSLEEIKKYIDATYGQHYSQNKYQATEFIIDGGHGTGFCIGNVLKYAQRYGRKGSREDWRSDLLKVIHYAIIQLHVHNLEDKQER